MNETFVLRRHVPLAGSGEGQSRSPVALAGVQGWFGVARGLGMLVGARRSDEALSMPNGMGGGVEVEAMVRSQAIYRLNSTDCDALEASKFCRRIFVPEGASLRAPTPKDILCNPEAGVIRPTPARGCALALQDMVDPGIHRFEFPRVAFIASTSCSLLCYFGLLSK